MDNKPYWICGAHPVAQAILNDNRKIEEIWCSSHEKIQKLKINKKIKISLKKNEDISKIFKDEDKFVHQGIAAKIYPLKQILFKDFLEKKPKNIVILDNIFDQRNIGSIIRTSYAFGIDVIIASQKTINLKSNSLHKASSGYIEFMKIILSSNVVNNIITLKKEGYYIIGLDSNSEDHFETFKYHEYKVLIFGSEGSGIRHNILKKCHSTVSIKMKNNVDSLNVSNSAAIVLSRI
jgi:23S rRNA (guanosine2251-2'-O)-methyltransferase